MLLLTVYSVNNSVFVLFVVNVRQITNLKRSQLFNAH